MFDPIADSRLCSELGRECRARTSSGGGVVTDAFLCSDAGALPEERLHETHSAAPSKTSIRYRMEETMDQDELSEFSARGGLRAILAGAVRMGPLLPRPSAPAPSSISPVSREPAAAFRSSNPRANRSEGRPVA